MLVLRRDLNGLRRRKVRDFLEEYFFIFNSDCFIGSLFPHQPSRTHRNPSVEGFIKVSDCTSALDSLDEFVSLGAEELLNGVVRGDDEGSVLEGCLPPFEFSEAGVLVQPDLEMVTEAVTVHVIEDDCLLAGITVPPFGLVLDVGIRSSLPSSKGFTGARWSPEVVSPTRVS